VRPYLEYILVILLPTAVGCGVILATRALRWAAERRRESRPPEPESAQRLAETLRRLRAELESMETAAGLPNKNIRVRALRGAYLDALGTACQRLEVSPPLVTGPHNSPRAYPAEIYRVEAALRQRGLDVREPADRGS
jgi:hypothetical protein